MNKIIKEKLFDNLLDNLDNVSEGIIQELRMLDYNKKENLLSSVSEGDKSRTLNYIGVWLFLPNNVDKFLTYKLIQTFDKI